MAESLRRMTSGLVIEVWDLIEGEDEQRLEREAIEKMIRAMKTREEKFDYYKLRSESHG